MNTRTYYESQIMKDLQEIPDESLPIFLTIVNSFKDLLRKNIMKETLITESTGFCGVWEDDRPVNEIVLQAESARNYFSNREM